MYEKYEVTEEETKEIIFMFQSDFIDIASQKHCANTMVRENHFDLALQKTFQDYHYFPQHHRLKAYFEKSLSKKNNWSSKEIIYKLNCAIFKIFKFK